MGISVLFPIVALLAAAVGQVQAQTAVIAGRLTRDGKPAAGVRVSAMVVPDPGVPVSEATALASVVLTDRDGSYRLENVPPGQYYLTAGFLDVPTYYPGVLSIRDAKAVKVDAGATLTEINFSTAAPVGVVVSGRVLLPSGQTAAPNSRASLSGGGQGQQVTLNADGSFGFSRVRPGTYTLTVSGAGSAQSATIVVGDANISGVELAVAFRVTGSVSVAGSGPLPRISLSFVSDKPDVAPREVSLSPAGDFITELPEGKYRLNVSGLPTGYKVESVRAGILDIDDTLDLSLATTFMPIKLTLSVDSPPPWVQVSGRVSGPGIRPKGISYQLGLTGPAVLGPLNLDVAEDGSFLLPKVLPGEYTLGVIGSSVPIVPRPLSVGNKDLTGVEVVVPAMKNVVVRPTIEGPGGAGAPFLVTSPQGGRFYMTTAGATLPAGFAPPLDFKVSNASGTATATATSQADKTFLVPLPDGEHRLELNVPGFDTKSFSYGAQDLLQDSRITIGPTDNAALELTLSPSAAGATNIMNSMVVANRIARVSTAAITTGGVQQFIILTSVAPPPAATAVYVGADVAQTNLLTAVPPLYPPQARAEAVSGTVTLRASIDKEGKLSHASVLAGHPMLHDAAIEAARQWRYRPHVVNGQPVAVMTTITMDFPPAGK
jgi:TonB family protein